jgi:hypothetical protein
MVFICSYLHFEQYFSFNLITIIFSFENNDYQLIHIIYIYIYMRDKAILYYSFNLYYKNISKRKENYFLY